MYRRFVKRILDLTLAVVSLPLVALMLAVAALAVLIADGRPVIFKASRMGRGGQPFTMYKLRTMVVDAPDRRMPDGSAYSAADDDRQTKVGRFLRRTSLDELPQVINVLKGEMSFIGPRPDDLLEAGMYEAAEARKLELRPGISGYAQVFGRNSLAWRDRLALDIEYVDKISFWLDLRIFWRTFAVVFGRQGLYAEDGAGGGSVAAGGSQAVPVASTAPVSPTTASTAPVSPAATAPVSPAAPEHRVRLVSLVVVAFDEQQYLPMLLQDIKAQDFPHNSIEVLLVDSNAGQNALQRQIMEDFADSAPDFRQVLVIENPAGSLPDGINEALAAFIGDVFVRIDAHARIPSDFIRRNVEVLEEGHDACGGWRPVVLNEPSPEGETLLAAESSPFGASAAGYRRPGEARATGSVFHGAYRRRVLAAVGFYDERLHRTEDNDYSQRIGQAGFQIWYDPRIRSRQFLRPDFASLLRQKAANGFWIGRTLWINPRAVSLLHLVPGAFVLALVVGVVLAFLLSWLPLLAVLGAYLLADAVASIAAVLQLHPGQRHRQMLALPLVFAAMHICYGCGTLAGLVRGLGR